MARSLRSSLAFLSSERLVMNTAFRFVYPFLPAIARGLGVPLEAAGLLVSARWVAGLATPGIQRIAGGGEARRRLIVTGTLLFIAGAGVTAITGVYVGALLGFALIGLAKPSYDIASQAYIADRVPYERRARYLAVFELTWALALLIGAPFTGWLIARGEWTTPFWVFGALTVVALVLVPRFVDPDLAAVTTPSKGVRFAGSSLAFLAVTALFTLGAETMFVVFGAWLEGSFGLTLAALGSAAVLIGFAELAGEGSTLAFTDRIGKRRSVLIGLMVSAVGFALLVPAGNSLGIGLAVLALGLFGFEFTIVSSIPLATELEPRTRARYLAWTVVAMATGRGIGAAIGPILFESVGLAGPAIVAVVANSLAAVVLVAWVREGGEPAAESRESSARRGERS
ncbi:MAG: MFS transporter [Acidimicrobiia bacterium]|nr:MAG: MFS transporter [Acidimicrobiia bacterium]